VLVLGASGFIGSRLVAALDASPTLRPMPASRRGNPPLDATNPGAMRSALGEARYVVNCIAGRGRTMTLATQTLCDAARDRPPLRIVHLSSMAVYGSATGRVTEDHAPVPPLGGYGAAKRACERIVRTYVDDGGDAVILRPTCVFGPGSAQWTTRVARLLRSRRLGDLGPAGDGTCNLAFIDDLVDAIMRSLTASGVAGQAFNISGPPELNWNDFLIRYGKLLGATPIRRISQRTLTLESQLMAPTCLALRRLGLPAPEAVTPSLLTLMRQDIRIDSTAAADALAFRPTPVDRMLAVSAVRGMVPA
jgi:nucleoside-diphosphate-sugar epimerase